MKTIYLFFALLLLTCGIALGQVGYGVEVGIGMASMKFSPMQTPVQYTTGSVSGIAAARLGGLIDVPLSNHFSFQGGLYIERKGAIRYFGYYINDSFNETVQQTLHLYYATLSMLLVWKSGIQGKGRMTLGLGPAPAYLVGGKNKLVDQLVFSGVSSNTSGTYPAVAGKTVTGFDIGVHALIGYELPTGLFFRFSYTSGTQDIGVGDEKDKNRTWCISAGYIFGKGRNINKEVEDLIAK